MIGKNNPFNIRTSAFPWKGQTGSTCGFCDFSHKSFGVRVALYLLLRSYRKRGLFSIRQIVSRFAPVTENDTSRYINYICKNVGLSPDEPLVDIRQYIQVLRYMSCFEGNPVSVVDLLDVYEKYKTDFQY